MGLDMFLNCKIYLGAKYDSNKITGAIDIARAGEKIDIPLNKVSYIITEAGYWRKANQIHNWFVENVQDGEDDCTEYYVSGEKLKELRSLCKDVLKHHSVKYSSEKLPVREGPFFGGYNYDNYYYQDLKDTIKIIDDIEADDPEFKWEYTYQASW